MGVKVNFPTIKSSFFNKYAIYQIDLKYKMATIKIHRRFRDFEALYNALNAQLPLTFLPQPHKKQAMGNLEKPFLLDRTEELNSFLKFILGNYDKYSIQPLHIFLN